MSDIPFSRREVAVVMTGAEWVTVLARILGKPLSPKGQRTYVRAADKMNKQLMKAGRVGNEE